MRLKDFANKHRLRVKHDPSDGTDVVPGRIGQSHLFEFGDDLLGVAVIPNTGTSNWWTKARRTFREAGMTVTQNGDAEGIATFDPANSAQVKAAFRYAGIRSRRKLSAAQGAALDQARQARNLKRTVERVLGSAPDRVLLPRTDDRSLDRVPGSLFALPPKTGLGAERGCSESGRLLPRSGVVTDVGVQELGEPLEQSN